MIILYDVGLLLALLLGGAIGLLVTAGHYEQVALRQWEYEKEIAENRELYWRWACSGASSRTMPRMTRPQPRKPARLPGAAAGRTWNPENPSDLG